MDGVGDVKADTVSVQDDHLDVLYLTHNYPRHATDYSGRFIARLVSLIQSDEGFKRLGVLAPHDGAAPLEEEVDSIHIRRFRYAPDQDERLAYRGDWKNISLFGPFGILPHWRFFRAFARDAAKLVTRYRPRLIHAHWWVPAGWVARRFARDIPLIVTMHGSDLRLLEAKPWMRLLAGRVFRHAALVTTVSTWLARSVERMFPDLGGRIGVSPMPPNDKMFYAPTESLPPNEVPLILCVTRFTEQKRTGVLLDALDILRARNHPFCCRIIGDGGVLKDSVVRRVREIGDSVEMVGTVDQATLGEEYRRADLTVLPAVDEGFGMALVEAQLCGCAVLGADSGGIRDIIEDGDTGFLAPSDNPSAWADVLESVLSESGRRKSVAQKGRESALRNFSSAAVGERYLDWYRALAASE